MIPAVSGHFDFDHVAFFGRTLAEYEQMFSLDMVALRGLQVLDCPGGPGSFAAEASAQGVQVVAVDPMYAKSPEELASTGVHDVETGLATIQDSPAMYRVRDLLEYGRAKREALQRFIADFTAQRHRYVAGQLPSLPFADRSFDVVLSAHLLFTYAAVAEGGLMRVNGFDVDWHCRAALELARVARREIRLYPTAAMAAEPKRHTYAEAVADALRSRGWDVEYLPSRYSQLADAFNDCLVARRGASGALRAYDPQAVVSPTPRP